MKKKFKRCFCNKRKCLYRPKARSRVLRAENKVNDNSEPKSNVFHSIWLILTHRKDTKDNLLIGTFAFALSIFFIITASIGFLFSINLAGHTIVNMINACHEPHSIFNVFVSEILKIMFAMLVFLFSVLLWGASEEVKKIKDINVIASVFSSVVSLVALIVSIVSYLSSNHIE